MNQLAEDRITEMWNCFPQTNQNYDVLLSTLGRLCAGLSDQAIIEAADRFAAGEVAGQSKTFAPSGPEFRDEVKRCEEVIALRNRPRLPSPPKYIPGPKAPFQIKTEQARAANAHLPILFEGVGFDEFRKLSAMKQIPEGAKWVAALGIIYGPEPKAKHKAA